MPVLGTLTRNLRVEVWAQFCVPQPPVTEIVRDIFDRLINGSAMIPRTRGMALSSTHPRDTNGTGAQTLQMTCRPRTGSEQIWGTIF